MVAAVGSPVFTVELEMFIAAPQRLVWKAPTAFSPWKYTRPLGSCGNCLEASDFDISWALCKDTIRSAFTLAYSPGSSHRIPWQLAGDSWVGSQEVLGSCRSFMTAVGRGGDFETVLHMVVVPGHTCWHCGFQGSPDIRGWWPLLTAPPQALLVRWFKNNRRQEALTCQEAGSAQLSPLQPSGPCVHFPGGSGIGSPLGPSPEVYMQIRGAWAVYLSLIWSEMCACVMGPFLSPNWVKSVITMLRPPNNPVPWVSPKCTRPQAALHA